jgi:Clp amino terminal domain, pathogenicity island component
VGQIPFTPRAKKVLELSLREALGLDHDYIGTEHILLGLLREGEGVAARILLELEVDAEQVRAKLFDLLGGPATIGRGRAIRRFGRRAVFEALPASGRWEYRVERADIINPEQQDWLNTLGAEGWELVAVVPQADRTQLVFKRPCRPARRAVG